MAADGLTGPWFRLKYRQQQLVGVRTLGGLRTWYRG
jgi:hypothetical protein